MKRELTTTDFHAMLNTDLGRDLKLEQETVEITGNEVRVYDSKHNEILTLNGVIRLDVESGITISKLA